MDATLAGRQLVSYTDRSIVDHSELREEIAATRERGYAVNPGGWWLPPKQELGRSTLSSFVHQLGRNYALIAWSITTYAN